MKGSNAELNARVNALYSKGDRYAHRSLRAVHYATRSTKRANTRNNSEVVVEPDKQAMAFEEIRSSLEINRAGRLLLKGQEMVLLPRHFFRYILREVNDRAQAGAFEDIFHKAGFDGAFTFCTRYREIHKCSPQEAVEGYLAEMSVRGWGAFDIELFIPDDGILHVVLTGSALIPEGDLPSGHLIWKEAMLGAVRSLPNISERTALAATMEETADGCRITVRPE